MPDPASLPVQLTCTGWLNQPPSSGASAPAVIAPGAMRSIDTTTLRERWIVVDASSWLVAEQVTVIPLGGVSLVNVAGSQPWVLIIGRPASSVTVQFTVTLLRNHPLSPAVPNSRGVITGAAIALGASSVATATAMAAARLTAPPACARRAR